MIEPASDDAADGVLLALRATLLFYITVPLEQKCGNLRVPGFKTTAINFPAHVVRERGSENACRQSDEHGWNRS